jgi:single stranded DNA-binding protein (ssb)
MNTINLLGRIANRPEVKTTSTGKSKLFFTLAVSRPYTKDTTDFISCIAWEKTAMFITEYFPKGQMIGITGSLRCDSWKDDRGAMNYRTDVHVENAYFTGDKR